MSGEDIKMRSSGLAARRKRFRLSRGERERVKERETGDRSF